jgi:hypothetical protein
MLVHDSRVHQTLVSIDTIVSGWSCHRTDGWRRRSGLDEADAQDVAFSLQLSDALELDCEFPALRTCKILELLDATLQRAER